MCPGWGLAWPHRQLEPFTLTTPARLSTSHRFTMETPKLSISSSPTSTHKEAGEEPLLRE